MDEQQESSFDSTPLEEDLASRRIIYGSNPTYQRFLDRVAHIGRLQEETAERAATSILCLLEQQLTESDVSRPDDHLPYALLELVQSCERRGELPPLTFDEEEFVYSVANDLDVDDTKARYIIRTVFTALREHLGRESSERVAQKLPNVIQNLWFAKP